MAFIFNGLIAICLAASAAARRVELDNNRTGLFNISQPSQCEGGSEFSDSDVLSEVLQRWTSESQTVCSTEERQKGAQQAADGRAEEDVFACGGVTASQWFGTLSRCTRAANQWQWADADWSLKPLGSTVGVSGAAMFLGTAGGHKKIILKSVSQKEVNMLERLMKVLAHECGEFPPRAESLLPKVFGIIRIMRGTSEAVYLMTDFVGLQSSLLAFDLKGTIINRLSPESATTRMDEDFLREQRILHLPGGTCEQLGKNIAMDTNILAKSRVVDYSLFASEACLTTEEASGVYHPRIYKSLLPSRKCPENTQLYYSFGILDVLGAPFQSGKRIRFFMNMRIAKKLSVAQGPGVPSMGYATRFAQFFASICPYGDTRDHLQLTTRAAAEAALNGHGPGPGFILRPYDVDGDLEPNDPAGFSPEHPKNLWDRMYYQPCTGASHRLISFTQSGDVFHAWHCVKAMSDVEAFLRDRGLRGGGTGDAQEVRVWPGSEEYVEDGAMPQSEEVTQRRIQAANRGKKAEK